MATTTTDPWAAPAVCDRCGAIVLDRSTQLPADALPGPVERSSYLLCLASG